MLTAQENEQLTRVGAGTPMGELQRRYWHPIAAVEELKDSCFDCTSEAKVTYEDHSVLFE